MSTYIHDPINQILYRLPAEPSVIERKDRLGSRAGWFITMTVEITRPDNRLIGGKWGYPTSAYPIQEMGARYDKDQAVSYFLMRHEPRGKRISEELYRSIKVNYEAATEYGGQA